MNILFDTNIILALVRTNNYEGLIEFLNPTNVPAYISIVSEAEIKSIAIRNNWGANRVTKLETLLDQMHIIEINQLQLKPYIEIDTYSQQRNPSFSKYSFTTARNMGKNDIWIASLAALLGLCLITTDADFDHLDQVFFDVRKISLMDLSQYF